MKHSKIKEYFKVAVSTVTAVAVFGGLLLGSNHLVLQAATGTETYLPAAVEDVGIPGNPVTDGHQTPDVTIIDITDASVTVPSTALSLQEAAQVGAQYIMDIFGENIDGMYLELEFANWGHMSRYLLQGVVSSQDRDTVARRNRSMDLRDKFMARIDAGECPREVRTEWAELEMDSEENMYIRGYFYFTIDATTGERVDIRRIEPTITMNFNNGGDPEALNNYIETQWGGDWESALATDAAAQDLDEFIQLAKDYAQRHFTNTTVVDVEYNHSFASLIYSGNGNFSRSTILNFLATDDTGREALVTIEQDSRTVMSISTMHNDIQRIEFDVTDIDIEALDGEMIYVRTHASSDTIARFGTRIVEGWTTGHGRGTVIIH